MLVAWNAGYLLEKNLLRDSLAVDEEHLIVVVYNSFERTLYRVSECVCQAEGPWSETPDPRRIYSGRDIRADPVDFGRGMVGLPVNHTDLIFGPPGVEQNPGTVTVILWT